MPMGREVNCRSGLRHDNVVSQKPGSIEYDVPGAYISLYISGARKLSLGEKAA